jgi:hypothetical protein
MTTICYALGGSGFVFRHHKIIYEDGRGGILVSKNGYQFVRVLFLNNSKIAWIEYLVSNPEYREEDRQQAIQRVIYELCVIAKK